MINHCVAHYKAFLSYHSGHNLHHFTFYPLSDNPPYYHFLSGHHSCPLGVKLWWHKHKANDDQVALTFKIYNHISLSLFLLTLAPSWRSQWISALTGLCNIIIKVGVQVYEVQTCLSLCYNWQSFSNIWVHCKPSPAKMPWERQLCQHTKVLQLWVTASPQLQRV